MEEKLRLMEIVPDYEWHRREQKRWYQRHGVRSVDTKTGFDLPVDIIPRFEDLRNTLGMNMSEFCKTVQLPYQSYFYWVKKNPLKGKRLRKMQLKFLRLEKKYGTVQNDA